MSNPPAEPVRTDELRLDAQNPWPGLTAFKEQQQDFFFGRKEEASELFSCIKRERITVLFGKSGLGKTSLLQAGLFPQLRHASFLPIYIRLSYAEGAPSLESQMQAAFEGAIKSADLAEVASAQPGESIWEYLHRRGGNLINYEGGVVTPVLVFDQFEEWFTLGSRKDFMFRLSEEFLPRLTDLIENRTPRALTEKLTQNRELARRYDLEAPGCRILITLREDYLANLENLRDAMPSLVFVDNRMRLTEMNGRQAFAVVSEPNPELVDSDVAGFIVRFVAGAHADGLDGKVRTGDTTLEHLEIAPAILSLFCRQLNQERLKQNLSGITRKLVTAQGVTIIDDFYKQSIADMHPAVRRLIEDRLLTKAGYRDNIDLAQARTDLEQAGANSSCLDDLVRLRLLQVEEHRGLPRLELTHDVLADPVKRSRDQWDREQVREKQRQQEREALAQAKQAEQVAVRKARFLQRVIATITLVSVLLAALLVYALKKRSEAQTSEKGEKQAVLDAEQAKAKAERAQTDAERAKADADQAKLAKAEADALTIKQKDGELQMFRQHEADRNSLANVSLNSLEHCLSIANYFLRLGQEKKSQAWLEVYESFLMEGDQCFGLAQTVHKLMPENLEITDDLITIPLNAAESARLRADKKKVREYCDSAVNEADRLQNERKDRGTKILAARTYVAAASKLAEVGDETAKAKDDQGMSVVAELRARSTLKDFGDRDWHNLGAVYSYHGDFLTSSKKDPEAIQSYKESFNAEVNAHTRKPRDKAKAVLSGRRRWESSQSIEREWIRCDLRFFRFELRSAKKGLPEGEERRCENGE